jgi:hypothetical protein
MRLRFQIHGLEDREPDLDQDSYQEKYAFLSITWVLLVEIGHVRVCTTKKLNIQPFLVGICMKGTKGAASVKSISGDRSATDRRPIGDRSVGESYHNCPFSVINYVIVI